MSWDNNNLKAEFAVAYLRAITHAAGYFAQESGRMLDADGVDCTLFGRGAHGLRRAPRLDVQLKATSQTAAAAELVVDLSLKNYDELRDTHLIVTRILVLVVVPEQRRDWLVSDEDQLVLRRCAYWRSLHGEPESDNTTKQRIKIPGTSLFNVAALTKLMCDIARGDR